MKKVFFAFAVLATVAFASCGSNASKETTTEETTTTTECTEAVVEECTNDSTKTECCEQDSAAVETPAVEAEVKE